MKLLLCCLLVLSPMLSWFSQGAMVSSNQTEASGRSSLRRLLKKKPVSHWRTLGSGWCEQDFLRGENGVWTAASCQAKCISEPDCVFISVVPGAHPNTSTSGVGRCSRYGEFTSCSVRVNGPVGSWSHDHTSYRSLVRSNYDQLLQTDPSVFVTYHGVCQSTYLLSSIQTPSGTVMTPSDCEGICETTTGCVAISVTSSSCYTYSACPSLIAEAGAFSYAKAPRTVGR